MSFSQKIFPVFLFSILPVVFMPLTTQAQQTGFPDAPGKDLLMSKCFQCHNETMWQDHRQDRKGWEGTLYRMIGRGALWSDDEIRSMAGYLATGYGPQSSKTSQ
ncbi:MAG TPA: hypothetical protein VK138_10965 [Acidiferrobacterales bacterium]|nr:hypothetical protein [Acidiferrobacterales bacterium]